VPLEAGELGAAGAIVYRAGSHTSPDYRRDGRSPFPARAGTAGERRGDVVQRSHEENVLLARVSVAPKR
jgi:hypothetical protein